MRIKITFNNEAETYLPINNNFYLSRLIHELIYGYGKYLQSLSARERRTKPFDMFTFSQLIIPYRQIVDWEIGILSDEFYWYIASPYPQFLGIIAMRLRELKKARIYKQNFRVERVEFMPEPDYGRATRWLTCLTIDPKVAGIDRDAVIKELEKHNIEARPTWKPMHLQPLYEGCKIVGGQVSEDLFAKGLCLASGTGMTDEELERVIGVIRGCFSAGD